MSLKPTNRMNKKSKNFNNFTSLFKQKSIEDRLFEANNLINFVELKKDRSALPELELAIKLLEENLLDYGDCETSTLLLARLFLWQDRLEEALELCNKILNLNKYNYLGLHIRGVVQLHMGEVDGAIIDLLFLHKINPEHGLVAWNLANAYFSDKKYKLAWSVFDRANSVLFNNYPRVPLWSGEDLDNTNIILTQYNSCGGGDDIMYAQIIPEVLNIVKSAFIETDPRTFSLYQQSFKGQNIFLSGDTPWVDHTKIDFQIMVPSLGTLFRQEEFQFKNNNSYLKPAHTEIKRWDKLIKKIANKNLKVGICWRSLISIGLTGPFSSNLDDWGEILKIPNISFFELQYDESEKERQRAENLFNTEIHKLDNVDMMTEFEKISAICLNMDIVISAVTTVALIANASGARVWELRPEYTALDMSGLPCFPNRQIYSRGHSESWKTVLSQVAKDLNKLMNESRE